LLLGLILQANGFFDKTVRIHPCANGFDNGAVAIHWKTFKIKPGTFAVLTNNKNAPPFNMAWTA